MLLVAGISPAGVQVAYRIGDSLTNCITPVFPYLDFILDYAQRYDDRAKTGTIISLALPYSLSITVVWLAFLILWAVLDLPIGPGGYSRTDMTGEAVKIPKGLAGGCIRTAHAVDLAAVGGAKGAEDHFIALFGILR